MQEFYRITVGADTPASTVIAPSAAVRVIRRYRRPSAFFRALLRGNTDAAVLRVSPQGAFSPGLAALVLNEMAVPIIVQVPDSLPSEWLDVFRRLQPSRRLVICTSNRIGLQLLRKAIRSRRDVRNTDQAELDLLARSASSLSQWIPAQLRGLDLDREIFLRKSLGAARVGALLLPEGGRVGSTRRSGLASLCASLLNLWYPIPQQGPCLPARPEVFSSSRLFVTLPDDRDMPRGMVVCERDGGWPACLRGAWAAFIRQTLADALQIASLRQQADQDPLTGAWNRRRLTDDIRRIAAAARRRNMSLAVAFVDLESLAEVNRRFGYTIGDRYLSKFASDLQHAVGAAGRVYRYGGDEFIVLMTASSCRAARIHLAQALKAAAPTLPDGRLSPPARITARCASTPSEQIATTLLADCITAAHRHTCGE